MHFMCETFRQYFLESENKMESGRNVVRNAGARTLDDDAQYQNNAQHRQNHSAIPTLRSVMPR